MRPLLYLDVDGVLNCPLAKGAELLQVSCDWGVLPVHAPPGVRERLRELDQLFDVVWATAWFGRGRFVHEALGLDLGPWPVLEWRDLKLTEIPGHAQGRPFAWVDDDVAFELSQLPEGFSLPKQSHLLLGIDPERGLDEDAMEKLRAFAAENGSGTSAQARS